MLTRPTRQNDEFSERLDAALRSEGVEAVDIVKAPVREIIAAPEISTRFESLDAGFDGYIVTSASVFQFLSPKWLKKRVFVVGKETASLLSFPPEIIAQSASKLVEMMRLKEVNGRLLWLRGRPFSLDFEGALNGQCEIVPFDVYEARNLRDVKLSQAIKEKTRLLVPIFSQKHADAYMSLAPYPPERVLFVAISPSVAKHLENTYGLTSQISPSPDRNGMIEILLKLAFLR